MGYDFQPYDVLQSNFHGTWHDYATIRFEDDAKTAIGLCDGTRTIPGGRFRIRRNGRTVYRAVVNGVCQACDRATDDCTC